MAGKEVLVHYGVGIKRSAAIIQKRDMIRLIKKIEKLAKLNQMQHCRVITKNKDREAHYKEILCDEVTG